MAQHRHESLMDMNVASYIAEERKPDWKNR